jgi:hypothetical protein
MGDDQVPGVVEYFGYVALEVRAFGLTGEEVCAYSVMAPADEGVSNRSRKFAGDEDVHHTHFSGGELQSYSLFQNFRHPYLTQPTPLHIVSLINL